MCTLVILHRPENAWPLILAGNRDEMVNRPCSRPGRHWPDLPTIVAGLDRQGGGSWMGLNDQGVAAVVMNREGTLGQAPGKKSRGELVLLGLSFANATAGAEAAAKLAAREFRPFNLVLADADRAYWVRLVDGSGNTPIEVNEIPSGLHMLSARELNDRSHPRLRIFGPRFAAAQAPDPGSGSWSDWQALLAVEETNIAGMPEAAMCFSRRDGFGTVSSSCMALPADRTQAPLWLYADGPPHLVPFQPVPL